MTDKQWQLFWDELVKEILATTTIDSEEPQQAGKERIEKLEAAPEDWFRYYFPAYAYARPAQFHREATERILDNPEWYEVRMWSRELAKSTRTMMEVFYLILAG